MLLLLRLGLGLPSFLGPAVLGQMFGVTAALTGLLTLVPLPPPRVEGAQLLNHPDLLSEIAAAKSLNDCQLRPTSSKNTSEQDPVEVDASE